MVPSKSSHSYSGLLFLAAIAVFLALLDQMDALSQAGSNIENISNESTQYVIYENSTYGIRLEFPKLW